MVFFAGIMLSFSSCLVTRRHDNGRHSGWYHKYDRHTNDRGRTVRVYKYKNHKQPAKKQYKSSKSKKSNKNHWDAKR